MYVIQNAFLRYLLQAFNYAVFMLLIWYFATSPSLRIIEDDEAMLTIAFSHAGELKQPCRRLSQEELLKLPPNMRKLDDCPRERSPVTIIASVDGKQIYNKVMLPPGLYGDGGVNIFFSGKVPAGKHHLSIKMDDSVRKSGFDHFFEQDVDIEATKILLVEFDKLKGFMVIGE